MEEKSEIKTFEGNFVTLPKHGEKKKNFHSYILNIQPGCNRSTFMLVFVQT